MLDSRREESVGGGQRQGRVLASLALCMLLSSLGISIANVALPTLAEAFTASFQQVQWVVLAYLLAVTTSIVSVGRLGDIAGRRRLLLAGIALFTAASGLCGVAPGLWLLVLARAAQGVGAAVMMALAMASVGEAVPKPRIGSAMGLLGTTSAVGTALGPSLGGALIAGFGWQAIFVVNLPLGALAFALARQALPADPRSRQRDPVHLDVPGTLLLTLTLATYALAMTVGRGRFGAINLALLLVAVLAGLSFATVEVRAQSPLISWDNLRQPLLRAGLASSALVSTVMMATLVVGPFHLARALGLDTVLVGLAMSVGPAVAALSGVPDGRLVDSHGARRTTAVGLAGMVTGCVTLSVLATTPGLGGYLVPIALITASYSLFQTANNTAVMADVSLEQRGFVSGILNLSRNLGLITGASVMGAVFALASRARDVATARPEEIAGATRTTFAVAAALLVAALAVALSSRAGSPMMARRPAA